MSEPVFDWKKELKDVSQLKVRDKLDWGELVRLQINRCLMSLSDIEHPKMFESHVQGLLNLIPKDLWDKDFEDTVKKCSEEKDVEKPQHWCGVIIQPIPKVKEKVTNHKELLMLCIGKFHKLGLGMKVKEETIIV